MPTRMFRDWRMALLWAVSLMASVAAFFSDGGGHEELAQQAREIANQRVGQLEKAQAMANPAATRRPPPVGDERVIDDELAYQAEIEEPDSKPLEPDEEPSPAAVDEASFSAAQPAQPMQP